MKKFIVVILISLLLTGCSKENNEALENIQGTIYVNYNGYEKEALYFFEEDKKILCIYSYSRKENKTGYLAGFSTSEMSRQDEQTYIVKFEKAILESNGTSTDLVEVVIKINGDEVIFNNNVFKDSGKRFDEIDHSEIQEFLFD